MDRKHEPLDVQGEQASRLFPEHERKQAGRLLSLGLRKQARRLRYIQSAILLILTAVSVSCPWPSGPWRSELYPLDWTPDATYAGGRFLHDFSYAGYHYGEDPLPDAKVGPLIFNTVTNYGADNTGAADATTAIQNAIDAAEVAGGVVYLPAGLYRCDGVLRVDAPGVAIRGDGADATKLYFTKSQDMAYKSHITFQGTVSRGPDILLAVDGENRAFDVFVNDASSLSPGDEVSLGWVITDDFVAEHGMTGTWQAFNGNWQAIFRRTVVAVDTAANPDRVTLDVPLRYPALVRDGASLRKESGYLSECGVEDLALANAVDWDDAWDIYQVHILLFSGVKDCWVRGVESFASPFPPADGYHLQSCGIEVVNSKRVTVADCVMQTAQNRGGGGCGYLFEISQSNEGLIRDCAGLDGRHNFIQNWGFGTTGCVFLRCYSAGSTNLAYRNLPVGLPAYNEYHHSLAMANLVDQCTLDDGWYAGNRKNESSGAGHTSTQCVFWNTDGRGVLRSFQYGTGYVIGTEDIRVDVSLANGPAQGTAPADHVEGEGQGGRLVPESLYEDQLEGRIDE